MSSLMMLPAKKASTQRSHRAKEKKLKGFGTMNYKQKKRAGETTQARVLNAQV